MVYNLRKKIFLFAITTILISYSLLFIGFPSEVQAATPKIETRIANQTVMTTTQAIIKLE
jgi:hypothetical protein